MEIPCKNLPQHAPSRYEMISISYKVKPRSAGSFLRTQRVMKAVQLCRWQIERSTPDVNLVGRQC